MNIAEKCLNAIKCVYYIDLVNKEDNSPFLDLPLCKQDLIDNLYIQPSPMRIFYGF